MKYFQHDTDTRTNRKLRKVLRTHGTTGYAIWWAVLEELYKSDDAGFSINADELWLETMAESLCISDHRTLIRVFDTFAEIGLISRQHWEEHYLFVPAIQERGDNYIQKKVLNAQRQERFRQKKKEAKEEKSRVSNALRNAENGKVTLSDPDPDPDPDPEYFSPLTPQTEKDEEEKTITETEQENSSIAQQSESEPEANSNSTASLLTKAKTVARLSDSDRDEIIPPAAPKVVMSSHNATARFEARLKARSNPEPQTDPWRTGQESPNQYDAGFVEFVRKCIHPTDFYQRRGGALDGDAKNWIHRREKDESDREIVLNHWSNYQESIARQAEAQSIYPEGYTPLPKDMDAYYAEINADFEANRPSPERVKQIALQHKKAEALRKLREGVETARDDRFMEAWNAIMGI